MIDDKKIPNLAHLEAVARLSVVEVGGVAKAASEAFVELYGVLQNIGNLELLSVNVAIPTSGWKRLASDAPEKAIMGDYDFYCEIPIEGINADMIPWLSIYPACTEIANESILAGMCQTVEGKIRIFAKFVPNEEIRGILRLFKLKEEEAA